MKKILMVLSLVLVAALALSACAPDDQVTDAQLTQTAEAGLGVEATPVVEDPALQETPVEPAPIATEVIETPVATDVVETPVEPVVETTPDAALEVDDDELVNRLSNLIDFDVLDQQGEDVGDVVGFVTDMQTGQIHYVLVDADSALDIEGDAVALPWNALTLQRAVVTDDDLVDETQPTVDPAVGEATPVADPATAAEAAMLYDDPHFVLNVDRQVLVGAPVIDDLDDVDFAAPQWRDEFAGYWEGQLAGLPATGEAAGELMNPVHLDEVSGYDIYNMNDEQIADVAEMIVNPDSGQITHIIAAVGGFLGLGESYVPVPFQSFEYDQEEERFLLDASQEQLENAPAYESMDDLFTTDEGWDTQYNEFWTVEGGRQVEATPTP